MRRAAGPPQCSLHRQATPFLARPCRLLGAGRCEILTLDNLRKKGPSQLQTRGQLVQACVTSPRQAQHFRRDAKRLERGKKGLPLRAVRSGTFSDDPWQEDSGRHEVLESMEEGTPWQRLARAIRWVARLPEIRAIMRFMQILSSLLFVVLYVWGTYSSPKPFSWRFNLDIALCTLFATEWLWRLLEAESKIRMLGTIWNLLDFMAFFPPLMEMALLYGAKLPFSLGRFDLRWFKILRALRVLRISLLAGEMRSMHLSSSGALLSGAASIRLYQLVASVLTLLFTTSAIVHLVERIPFFDALYFVTTTLTTVGYGDVVAISLLGKAAVLAMILVGVVLIPVQTSQLYSQLTARRLTLGSMPGAKQSMILVGTRLTEVRGFSDFFSEFFTALRKTQFPPNMRMVVLCNRPNYELRAFQELNDRRLTLVEGSALSERDLVRTRAHAGSAILLLADRFSPSSHQEDLGLQFQVWAVKSYTKSVPVYVQVLQRASLRMIAPFLDPERDVLVSVEQMRHRLLALSCLCPGASTLIANLLRRAAVLPEDNQPRTAAGRRWLRAYINGCAFKVFDAVLPLHLAGDPFCDVVEWLYRTSGFVLIGFVQGRKVVLNPGRRRLKGGESGVFVATSQAALDEALTRSFSHALHPASISHFLKPNIDQAPAEVSQDVVDDSDVDDDDYFHSEAIVPCIPDVPDNLKSESDSVDLDELPCIVPENMMPEGAADMAAEAHASGLNEYRPSSAQPATSTATRIPAAAASITRMDEAVDGHRDAASGRVPIRKAADAISTSIRAAADRRKYSGARHVLASESYEEDEVEESEDMEDDGAVLPPREEDQALSAMKEEGKQEAVESERNVGDEGFVEDYIEHDHADEELSHPDQLSTSSRDDEKEYPQEAGPLGDLSGHVIICGAEGSFANFVEQLRRCDPLPTPVVVLHPRRPSAAWTILKTLGPIHFIAGEPSNGHSLRIARAKHARALAYLAHSSRPNKEHEEHQLKQESPDWSIVSRTAVLADAEGLQTCYGVGEESTGQLTHAVIELCFTSSVRFLQPGLLLQGMGAGEAVDALGAGEPRKSWQMRKRQERAALKEGLAEWQANPYYVAGRCTVPAIIDTLSASFFNRSMLTSLMGELAGDDGRPGGALLRQVDISEDLIGQTYGELFTRLTLTQHLIPLGLYRRKSENPAWRLSFVVTNPPWHERLEENDKVYVLRERGGPWIY